MRALVNDGQPRFRLPCAEVLLPSCARLVAAPRLRRQILVLLFGAAVTGCAGIPPGMRSSRPRYLLAFLRAGGENRVVCEDRTLIAYT